MCTASVPGGLAPEVQLAYAPRVTTPLLAEQGPDLVCGVVAMYDATYMNVLSL